MMRPQPSSETLAVAGCHKGRDVIGISMSCGRRGGLANLAT